MTTVHPKTKTVRIIASDHRIQQGLSTIPCIIGEDLLIHPDVLGSYCVRELSENIDDLVTIAGIVAFADRAVPRRTASSWPRQLHLTIPVRDRALWERTETINALMQTLDPLTGDQWDFTFGKRTAPNRINPQATLPLGGGASTVIPFSDGLDSLAVARLTKHREPDADLLLVTTGSHRRVAPDVKAHRVAIPFQIPSRVRLPETTYRSRAFIFGVMAGIAAQLANTQRILIPESGQSSLGPWLLPVGNEAPDIRTHPAFTTTLAKLLNKTLGTNLIFEHPQLWKTKGETLRELRELNLHDDWWLTRSCPRRRHVSVDNKSIQCGVCAACLLRRQSLHAAGLDQNREHYFWDNLHAETLEQAALSNARKTTRNDTRHAWCGSLELARLAEYANNQSMGHRLARANAELADTLHMTQETATRHLARLLAAHAEEWGAFLSSLGESSFLVHWQEARQC